MRFTIRHVLIITALVFAPVLTFDFVNLDDPSHLDKNTTIAPFTLQSLQKIWSEPYLKLYIPVTYTAWSALTLLSPEHAPRMARTGARVGFRFSPLPFHLANWGLHLLNVFLVYSILVELGGTGIAVLFATSLFAFHPLQVESVAWVSSLKDTLSAALFLGAFLLYLRAEKRGRQLLTPRHLLAFGLFFFSTLAKPACVVWPVIALLASTLPLRKPLRSSFLKLLPAFFLAVPAAWITSKTQPSESFGFQVPNLLERVWVAFDAMGFYFAKLLAPASLTIDYGRAPSLVLSTFSFLGLLGILVAAMGVFFSLKKRGTAFPTLCVFVLLFPVLGIIPFVFQTTSTVADRYCYLPLFAISMLLIQVKDTPLLRRVGIAVLTVFSLRTAVQLFTWSDTVSLLTHATEVNPKSWLAYNNLGSWYEQLNETEKALEYYEKSASIKPQSVVYNNIGAVLYSVGRFQEAAKAFQRGIEYNSLSALDFLGLASSLARLGERKKAEEAFQNAVRLNGDLAAMKNSVFSHNN